MPGIYFKFIYNSANFYQKIWRHFLIIKNVGDWVRRNETKLPFFRCT